MRRIGWRLLLCGTLLVPACRSTNEGGTPVPGVIEAKESRLLLRKMKKIVLPEVRLQNASLREAIDLLSKAARERDRGWKPHAGQGVPVLLDWRDIGKGSPLITYQGRKVSLYEALRTVSQMAGLRMRIEPEFVWIGSMAASREPLVFRYYPMDLSGLDKVRAAARLLGPKTAKVAQVLDTPGAEEEVIRALFERLGMVFPAQASVRLAPAPFEGIVMVNTAENIEMVERILLQIYPEWRAMRKLQATRLPEIDFDEVRLPKAVNVLVALSRKHDPALTAERGINVVLKVSEPIQKTRVTFRARDISLREALDAVTGAAGLKYRVKGDVVTIYPE